MDENFIQIDNKTYDLRQLSPTAIQTLQLVQAAQAKVNEANVTAQLANLALQSSLANMRAIIATQPVYTPSAPDEADQTEALAPKRRAVKK